jgi:hypothetical protein
MTGLPLTRISVLPDTFATPGAARRFHVGLAIAVALTVISGFAFSITTRPLGYLMMIRVIAHASMFFGWVALFVTQVGLIAAGRVRVHRRLGMAAALLALAMVLSAPPLAFSAAARGVFGDDSLAFLFVILVDLALFASFVGAGIYFRRRSDIHKRLMVLGMVSMLPPAISRWPIAIRHAPVIPAVLLLFLLATPLFDYLARRRQHPVTVWGGAGVVVSLPLRFAIAHSATWHAIAGWLVR